MKIWKVPIMVRISEESVIQALGLVRTGREYLADISDSHVSRQARAKHFRTST